MFRDIVTLKKLGVNPKTARQKVERVYENNNNIVKESERLSMIEQLKSGLGGESPAETALKLFLQKAKQDSTVQTQLNVDLQAVEGTLSAQQIATNEQIKQIQEKAQQILAHNATKPIKNKTKTKSS